MLENKGFRSFAKILAKLKVTQIRVYLWTEKGAFPCQMISE
nr:MAG TPA: hypothetical protein [Caudoviricetes sp.]